MNKLLHPVPLDSAKESSVSRTSIEPDIIAEELAVEGAVPCIVVVHVCMEARARPGEGDERRNIEILCDVVERLWGEREQSGALVLVIMMTDG